MTNMLSDNKNRFTTKKLNIFSQNFCIYNVQDYDSTSFIN